MIIDASAIIAFVNREQGYERIRRSLVESAATKIGSPTRLETGLVLTGRYGIRGRTLLSRFLEQNHIETIPFIHEHAEIALDAFSRFGKGRHPAALNFGDCMTYATAYLAQEPLLFVGDDFMYTDLPLMT